MKIKKAMVLAAGFGSRLKPITSKIPKPLLEIGKKNLLERCLDLLINYGVKDVAINLHYKGDKIRKFLKKKKYKNISILNISSTNSKLVSHQFFSYHLSKNIIETLTKYLSIKYINYNIKINCLRLGLISTKNLSKIVKPKIIKKFNLKKSVPNYEQISRFIKKNYIEDPLLNGTTLTLDGSLTNIDQIYFNIE